MNYWHILEEASRALAAGRFRQAETAYATATAAREQDARRVFLSETVPDGARRLWHRLRRRPRDGAQTSGELAGRWQHATAEFHVDFRSRGEAVLRSAERQIAASVTADPAAAAALLCEAMYLSVGSRLATRRLPAAGLLQALFALLPASGRLCDHDLVTAELALPAALRLQLAQQALPDLNRLPQGERAAWTRVLLTLLEDPDGDWQPGTGPARRWLAARLADTYSEEAAEVLPRWQACDEAQQPEANRRWSRLRRLEILADRDRRRLAVPSYREAHRLAALLSPSADPEEEQRCREAMAVVDYRRPRATPPQSWITATVTADGAVLAVYWWRDEPRDVARWRSGDSPLEIEEFLAAAAGRVLWSAGGADLAPPAGWPENGRGQALVPFLETMLEPLLPAAGWSDEFATRLALGRCGAWRSGWRADLGHPLLAPPGQDGRLLAEQAEIEAALHAGLLWLAVLHRVNAADPALRAGLGELARRGDPAARFLHEHAVLGAPELAAVDAGFAPWTLPLLWTRPDPLSTARAADEQEAERQDLAGQDVAVVVTGRPARVLPAWGPGQRRWRVVLDRWQRLGEFRRLARECYGPVTVVPPQGLVHDLQTALRQLDAWAAAAATAPPADRMLAICHWIRLVETHNGDLLDACVLRPRPRGACAALEHYAVRLADLPRRPVADDAGWAEQYAQRARRSGLVIGEVDDVPDDPQALDAIWGVFDGSEANWVFLDSAAVHWRLRQRRQAFLPQLHRMLASRGRRHLSLLSGRGLYPDDLARWLDVALAPYGRPYHAVLPDAQPPHLRLAGTGPLPGSHLEPGAAHVAALGRLQGGAEQVRVQLPAASGAAQFWRAAAAGTFGEVAWRLGVCGESCERLVVPQWDALDGAGELDLPAADSVAAWQAADGRRQTRLAELRRALALECGALLASPAGVVEVLDGRWWRLFAGDAPAALPRQDGGPTVEVFALPATGGEDRRRLAAAVAAWLVEQGRIGGAPPGWQGPALADGQPLGRSGGVRFHLAPAAALWRDLASELLRDWEHGSDAGRLLLVAERPPPGAAVLAAVCAGAGATVLASGEAVEFGAVVWARPAELEAWLAQDRTPPAFDRALVLALDTHCPPADGAAASAHWLGWLASQAGTRLDLVGGPLPEAWSRFFGARFAATGPASREPGGWSRLRRGEVPVAARICPQCVGRAQSGVDDVICRHCSYDLAGPGPRAGEVETLPPRVQRLLEQQDLGRDEPLELWAAGDDLQKVREVLQRSGAAADDLDDAWRLPDGRRWRLRDVGEPAPIGSSGAILLDSARDPATLRPWAGAGRDACLTLLYDRFDVAPPPHGATLDGSRRLLELLRRPQWLAAHPAAPGLRGATVPFWCLGWLAGLTPRRIRGSLALLRWVAVLSGDLPPRARGGAPGGAQPRWLIRVSLRDAEARLAALARRSEDLLESWLDAGLAGSWHTVKAAGAVDPADPGATTADSAIDLQLDALLAVLGSAPAGGAARLVYRAPAGAWFDARRLVGWLGDRRQLPDVLRGEIELVAGKMREMLAGYSLVDAGFALAATNAAAELTPRQALLIQMLGFWTRVGDGDQRGIVLEDLERLGAAAAVAADGPAGDLLQELASASDSWRQRLARAPSGGHLDAHASLPPAAATSVPPRSARWWRRERTPAQRPLQHEITAWLARPAPARLVVAGPYGSGRTESLLAALAASAHGRRAEFWCPDTATAVRVHMAARRLAPGWQPLLFVAQAGKAPPARPVWAAGEQGITVIVEVQRFRREAAYRLQERGRSAHLILSVDTADLEPERTWEDLFLITPQREEVRKLRVQVLQAGQPWRITRRLRPAGDAEERARRRDRGAVQARPAGTLDECAAALAAAVAADRLGRLSHLVAPLPEDVDLLTRALTDRGWAAVAERDLAPLLMPGVLETVAAFADATRRREGVWPGLSAAPATGDAAWTLAAFLTPDEAADYGTWLHGLPAHVLASAPGFLEHLRRSPWGVRCNVTAPARRRAEELAAAASAPRDALPPALWEAWRRRLDAALGRRGAAAGPAVACLSAATEPAAEPVESLAYICFGSEPAVVHRRVLARGTDRLLILYQECSPLADHWDG